MSRIFLIIGLLCFIVSVLFLALSFLSRSDSARLQQWLSLLFFAGGWLLLGLWWGLEWLKERLFTRHRARYAGPIYVPTPTWTNRPAALRPPPADVRRDIYRQTDRKTQGAALALLLILLGLMVALVLQVQGVARWRLQHARTGLVQAQLHQAAAEAARAALQRLAADDDLLADYADEPWARPQAATNPSGIATSVRILDENRFFDWNNLALPVLGPEPRSAQDAAVDLLTLCGDFSPLDRVEALRDWLDADSEGLAETAYYLRQQPPYAAANRLLYAGRELLMVRGFSLAVFAPHERAGALAPQFADLSDCVTIVPAPRERPVRVNINTASREVLLGLLGLERGALVQSLLDRRAAGPLRTLNALAAPADRQLQALAARWLDVKSLFFRVEAEASAEDRVERIQALVRRGNDGALDIVQWVF